MLTMRIHWTARSPRVYFSDITGAPPVMRVDRSVIALSHESLRSNKEDRSGQTQRRSDCVLRLAIPVDCVAVVGLSG